MLTKINRIKQNPIFKNESKFFTQYKDNFIQSFTDCMKSDKQSERYFLNKNSLAENFYDALFNCNKDCFKQHISWIKLQNNNIGFIFSSLMYKLIEAFMLYKEKEYKESINLVNICSSLQKEIMTALENKHVFDVSPYLPKKTGILYLQNMYKLGRNIRFITHTDMGTCLHMASVEQIGQHSAVIKISDEQMTMMIDKHSSFILKNKDDEKNFNVEAEILCVDDNTIIIKNMEELEEVPLISRQYPRAAIVHASLVHIANTDEYITGSMLDICEGGMGIVSSTKSRFKKGQDIVAFLSHEDKKSGFKFSFEANGIITSIIGIEHVFRYGIQLSLENEEKDMVRNIVEILNNTQD